MGDHRRRGFLEVAFLGLAFVMPMLTGCDGGITVRGHVYSVDGAPLNEVEATLSSETGVRPIGQEKSDSGGCFAFRATVAPGRNAYRVVADRIGYKSASATVFSGKEVNEVEMRLGSIDSIEESTSKVIERPLASDEPTYFDVRCAGVAGAR